MTVVWYISRDPDGRLGSGTTSDDIVRVTM
jgi:hypothetical protein